MANGHEAITAQGTALADCGGGDADRPFKRAAAFRALGYRASVVRDDDKKPTAGVEAAFIADGGRVFAWRDGRALEDELFSSLTGDRSEEHTSELQSLMRISYAVFCLKQKK